MTQLPAGWSIQIKDQGQHIGEVWLQICEGGGVRATIVVPRASNRGQTLLELRNGE